MHKTQKCTEIHTNTDEIKLKETFRKNSYKYLISEHMGSIVPIRSAVGRGKGEEIIDDEEHRLFDVSQENPSAAGCRQN